MIDFYKIKLKDNIQKVCKYCNKEYKLLENGNICDCEEYLKEKELKLNKEEEEKKELIKKENEENLKKLNIPPRYRDASKEHFRTAEYREWNLIEYMQEIEKNYYKGKGLYIYGSVGIGKTYLSIAIIKHLCSKINKIADIYILNSYDYFDYTELSIIKNIDILIIDDFLKKEMSTAELTKYEAIIGYRYNHYKYTIITSNIDIDKLNIDVAFKDRIKEITYKINMIGKSKRNIV